MTKGTDIKACIILTLLFAALLGQANAQEVKDYTVIKGDTLWGITEKELKDPFLWPKVWKENPDIKNPDRVYPGQAIRIPLYLMQKESSEAESSASAAPSDSQKGAAPAAAVSPKEGTKGGATLKPLVDPEVLMASGYIAESVPTVGAITGSPDDRVVFGVRDLVFVNTKRPVKIGEKFFIVRAENPVRHPLTDKFMGYMVEVLGVAEIKGFPFGETKAQITKSFVDILTGDLLVPYEEMVPPLTTGQHRKPNINATVIAAKGLQRLSGNLDVVYIDKGRREGVEIGDLYRTVIVGSHKIPNSIIQIISCQETTATAIVKEFSNTVTYGDWVTHLE